jgi:hypothetical protein
MRTDACFRKRDLEMASEDGEWSGRKAPFPPEMQGPWVEESDPSLEVIINGSEMTWRGEHRDYRDKRIRPYEDGFRQVEVDFAETDYDDTVELVVLPNGAMYAYNVHFVSLFIRPDT